MATWRFRLSGYTGGEVLAHTLDAAPPAALSPSDSSETASGRDAERQGQTLELLRWGYLSSLRGHLEDIKPNLGIH